MRKIITLFLLAFLLVGCSASSTSDLSEIVESVEDIPLLRSNTHSHYFSYYRPSDVSEVFFNDSSVILDYNGDKIVMNLNVAEILTDNSEDFCDDGVFAKNHKICEYQGTFDEGRRFELCIYSYDRYNVVHLNTSQVYLNSVCLAGSETSIVDRMLLIAKNVVISKEAIAKDFKTEDVIDYQRKQIDLFEMVIAPDGRLEDLIINNTNAGEGE